MASTYACAFFLASHLAFIIADNFFLAAGLIGRRTAFVGVVALAFGADLPFHFAHRCFIASEMRLRAAADMWRVRPAFGGRPRCGRAPPASASKAAIACSIRVSSERSWPNRLSTFMYLLLVTPEAVAVLIQYCGFNRKEIHERR